MDQCPVAQVCRGTSAALIHRIPAAFIYRPEDLVAGPKSSQKPFIWSSTFSRFTLAGALATEQFLSETIARSAV
jgi:hypothetical protein